MAKKKVYLIILLMLIFICLLSVNNISKGETFPTFWKRNDLYCGNRGWAFSSSAVYNRVLPSSSGTYNINGASCTPTINIPNTAQYNLSQLNQKANWMKLSYILSRVKEDGNKDKPSIGGSPYQVAIWTLLNQTNYPTTSTTTVKKAAANILAGANAYYQYYTTYGYGQTPKLSQGTNFGRYEAGNSTYMGPFSVEYKITTASANVGGQSGSGQYGEIVGAYLNGSKTTIYKRNTNGSFTASSDYSNFYIKVNTSNINNTIHVKQNSNARTATFSIYNSSNTGMQFMLELESIDGKKKNVNVQSFSIKEGVYFCNNCMSECDIYTDLNRYRSWINNIGSAQGSICPSCSLIFTKHPDYVIWDEALLLATPKPTIKELSGGSLQNMQNLISGTGNYSYKDSNTINFSLIQPLDLTLNKINTAGAGLEGAKFNVQATQQGGSVSISPNQPMSPGKVTLTPTKTSNITVTISEHTTPADHFGISEQVVITFKYSSNQWVMESIGNGYTLSNGEYINGKDKFSISGSNSKYNITIKNRPVVAKFEFTKLDELTNAGIQGITFNAKIQNLAGGPTNLTLTNPNDFDIQTGSGGKISFENMEFVLNSDGKTYKDIIITLTEKQVPTDSNGLPRYRFLHGPITITIRYNTTTHRAEIVSCTYDNQDNITYNGQSGSLSVTAKDQPIIHLGGKVWLEKQQGEKDPQGANGIIDRNEEGIPFVPVYLFKTEDGGRTFTKVEASTYGEVLITETSNGTDSSGTGIRPGKTQVFSFINPNKNTGSESKTLVKGEYFFPNLPKIANGYYVVMYSYDGVNYIATIDGGSQKANEGSTQTNLPGYNNLREFFNLRLQTIAPEHRIVHILKLGENAVVGYEMTSLSQSKRLEYDTYTGLSLAKSKLITTTDYNTVTHENGKHSNVKEEFKMFARTKEGYNETNLGITFGLKSRYLDLSLLNDIYEAEVSVNGITTVYTYNDIVNAGGRIEIKDDMHNEVSYNKGKYNLKLYKSDYESDYERTRGEKLKVRVTYAISLNNEGMSNLTEGNLTANVRSIMNYYDERFILQSAKDQNGNRLEIETKPNKTISRKEYQAAEIKGINNGNVASNIPSGGRKVIYLTFEVQGEGNSIDLKEYDNIAEIYIYNTAVGLVDKDSEPGSISINKMQFEDDTDRAQGIEILVPEGRIERIRAISGNVWEDMKTNEIGDRRYDGGPSYKYGNGEYKKGAIRPNDGDIPIQGIKVELYEVKNGTETKIDEKTTDGEGNYSFDRIIPGIYKVRFIYGTEKYNGQDYKSGIVSTQHYDREMLPNTWYYNSLYSITGANTNGNITTKAIDNSKMRLLLMAKYAKVDKTTYPNYVSTSNQTGGNNTGRENTGGATSRETNNNSQNRVVNVIEKMEANTPRIYTAIDINPNSLVDDFRNMEGQKPVKWNNLTDLKINGVSFALEKRPETKITVEEHIKRLTLRGNDNIVLAQAEVDNKDTLFNNNIANLTDHLKGMIGKIKAVKTTRQEPGFWEIETDIGEVLQGASLEAEIVYQVKNESEADYLSKTLLDEFARQDIDTYINILKERYGRDNIEGFDLGLMVIGPTYYTGAINNTVERVSTKIGKMQDYVGDLEFRQGARLEKISGGDYNKATGLISINKGEYNKITDLFNGNELLKHKETGEIITAVKDGETYWKVETSQLTERQVVKEIITTTEEIGTKLPGEGEEYNSLQGINGLTPTGKLDFENYMSEIMDYSIPTGRLDEKAVPGNLSDKFVYAEDKDVKLTANEQDEFAAERISIIPPTGEDKLNPVILIIAITAGITVLTAGIFLIKKYTK